MTKKVISDKFDKNIDPVILHRQYIEKQKRFPIRSEGYRKMHEIIADLEKQFPELFRLKAKAS